MSPPPSERFLQHSVQFQRLFRLSQRCFRLFQRLIELKGLQLWLQPRLSLRILRRFEQVLRQLEQRRLQSEHPTQLSEPILQMKTRPTLLLVLL
jgi:hypothetical protein